VCTEAYAELYDGEGAVLEKLSRVWKHVAELAALDASFAPFVAARESIGAPLQDLALALRERATHLEASPERLQAVEDRLAVLERIKRRHGPSIDDVLVRRQKLVEERRALAHSAERADELSRELEDRRSAFLTAARRLSSERRRVASGFGDALAEELSSLAMPGARCEVRFEPDELPDARWSPQGIDGGEFYLSANVGEDPRPLARIASGGELSRVMLGLKTLATTDADGKTLIFDEVDAGIGGRAADAVGARLRALGDRFQVLCITHLPQVAAHAHSHYRVTKGVRRGRTVTAVELLSREQRVEELGRMMGGEPVTPAVLAGARALLEARWGKEEAKGESESGGAKAKVTRRK
jgi:DNA repair protein RecN (Recombination protein N)